MQEAPTSLLHRSRRLRTALAAAPLAVALAAAAAAQVAPPGSQAAKDRTALYASLANEERMTPAVRVVQAVTPAVVFIQTEAYQQVRSIWGTSNRVVSGAGSGVVIHPAGYVVTNYHVVEGSRRITVSFDGDPGRYAAQLVSFVREEDLALLQILETPQSIRPPVSTAGARVGPPEDPVFPIVTMGTSTDLMPGEPVIAIGNPLGQTYTVSTGIISGLHRDIEIPQRGLRFHGLIQTDASINRGNSGGPLLNVRGELIGINSAMNESAENIGFAIPVDRVKQVLKDVLLPQARASWLGFEVGDGDSLRIVRVTPDGPADHAGICEGDVVLAVDGREVATREAFVLRSLQVSPGARVRIDLQRGDVARSVSLVAWEPLEGLLFRRMGVTVTERRVGDRTFVAIDRVQSGGPAHQIGMERGDLVSALRPDVGRQSPPYRVQDREVLAAIVDLLDEGTFIELDVYRDTSGSRSYERLTGRLKLR